MISECEDLADTFSTEEIYTIFGELFQSAIKEYNAFVQFVHEVMPSILSLDSAQTHTKAFQNGGKTAQERAGIHHHL